MSSRRAVVKGVAFALFVPLTIEPASAETVGCIFQDEVGGADNKAGAEFVPRRLAFVVDKNRAFKEFGRIFLTPSPPVWHIVAVRPDVFVLASPSQRYSILISRKTEPAQDHDITEEKARGKEIHVAPSTMITSRFRLTGICSYAGSPDWDFLF